MGLYFSIINNGNVSFSDNAISETSPHVQKRFLQSHPIYILTTAMDITVLAVIESVVGWAMECQKPHSDWATFPARARSLLLRPRSSKKKRNNTKDYNGSIIAKLTLLSYSLYL